MEVRQAREACDRAKRELALASERAKVLGLDTVEGARLLRESEVTYRRSVQSYEAAIDRLTDFILSRKTPPD